MRRLLATTLAALIGAAAIGSGVASADTTPVTTPTPPAGAPSALYRKNVRLEVSLQDTTALVFDATLDQVSASAPGRFRTYLEGVLAGELFGVDATAAVCFIDDGTATRPATCKQVADLVDGAADAVPATVLARAIPGDPLDFVAKKVIAHAEGLDAAPGTPSQSAAIDVSLSYAESDTSFDAGLDGVAGSVPDRLAARLDTGLGDTTFTLDASKAVCSIVTDGVAAKATCADIADLVNSSLDTVSATAVGRLVTGSDGTPTFVASKLVADADSASSLDPFGSAGSGFGQGAGFGQPLAPGPGLGQPLAPGTGTGQGAGLTQGAGTGTGQSTGSGHGEGSGHGSGSSRHGDD